MKALHFFDHGEISKLRYDDVETPKCGDEEVLIQVRAAALNHLDLWVLEGWPGLKLSYPHIGGADVAGVVAGIGSAVKSIKTGDRVVVMPGFATGEDEFTKSGQESLSPTYQILGEQRPGGFAQFVVVPAKAVRVIPGDLSFEEAAAPLLVGLTSWRMLFTRAQLKAGETVLIVGAGGGVNSFALQLAKAHGARVVALTSNAEKMKRARELGADEVLNYRDIPDWSREVRRITEGRGVDVVVDNVGAQTFAQSINSAARGGRIVTVGNTSGPNVSFDNRLIFTKQLSLLGSTMGGTADFDALLAFLAAKKVRPVIDQVLPLKDGKKGYEMLAKGTQFGKVILVPEQ